MPKKSPADLPLTLAQFDERLGKTLIKFYRDLIEPRFQKIESKLEEHDRRFDQVDGRFDDLYKKFDTIEQEYLFVNHQMKRLEKNDEVQHAELLNLRERVLRLEVRLDKAEKDFSE